MKVSICVPTYNSPVTLERLLKSVFDQTFTDYEVIISDDSSNDEVAQVIKRFPDPRLAYYHNDPPLGTPENWNNAVRHATGDIIKIMHHDDWFVSPDALWIFLDAMRSSQADFVFCQCVGEGANHPTEMRTKKYLSYLPLLLTGNVIGAPSVTMYRRTDLAYDARIKYYVDVDFYIAYLQTHTAACVERELVGIGTTPVRVTDDVVENHHLVYNEFQYVFLKLWNSKQWDRAKLLDVFRSYVTERRDFSHVKVSSLLWRQRVVLFWQRARAFAKSLKSTVKKILR